jgi:hypothetical protein
LSCTVQTLKIEPGTLLKLMKPAVGFAPAPVRRSPITISINGAEYLELAKRSKDVRLTMPAYVRTRCGLPAWSLRGREMAGRTSAIKKNAMALDRLAVTMMVTDAERA